MFQFDLLSLEPRANHIQLKSFCLHNLQESLQSLKNHISFALSGLAELGAELLELSFSPISACGLIMGCGALPD